MLWYVLRQDDHEFENSLSLYVHGETVYENKRGHAHLSHMLLTTSWSVPMEPLQELE